MNLRTLVLAVAVTAALFGATAWLKRDRGPVAEEAAGPTSEERARIRAFWDAQRTATRHRIAGRIEEAVAGYEHALSLDPNHEDALYYAGALHLQLGHAADARDRWQRLIAVNPVSARAHYQLGDLYMCPEHPETFDLAAAAAEFRSALAINQEETGPLLQLAEVAVASGQWDSAATLFSDVLRSNPGSQPALFYRGYVAWHAGRPDAALADFDGAVALAQPDEEAPSGLLEGETEGGSAMLAERKSCQQFATPVAGLGDSPGGAAAMNAAYGGVRTMLAEFRR
jgi:tetratricopeptide (TPR) repeat protein